MGNVFKPEGALIDIAENRAAMKNVDTLRDAMEKEQILEARALICDSSHNLIVDLGCCRGIIPREQAAIGIEEGTTRDIAIISRVNKPVCFTVISVRYAEDGRPTAILSRRRAQERCRAEYIAGLLPGDVIGARVTHLESFGCFVDIGCGVASLIPIDSISISRIAHPRDRFRTGQDIRAVVKTIQDGRITLTHKELLGTWDENARQFSAGETIAGIIRSVEEYGVFVELRPNLAGLAEPKEGARPGQHASVYIKNLIPEKMKVKLIIVDAFNADYTPSEPEYFTDSGHIDVWRYSPECSERVIETRFE